MTDPIRVRLEDARGCWVLVLLSDLIPEGRSAVRLSGQVWKSILFVRSTAMKHLYGYPVYRSTKPAIGPPGAWHDLSHAQQELYLPEGWCAPS